MGVVAPAGAGICYKALENARLSHEKVRHATVVKALQNQKKNYDDQLQRDLQACDVSKVPFCKATALRQHGLNEMAVDLRRGQEDQLDARLLRAITNQFAPLVRAHPDSCARNGAASPKPSGSGAG